ncbi:cation diffusion facilitator family transporter [Parvibaculum lavamentivorans DS-1]|uniref:Cation diffusion facilitator family transporter n=1 Tax=Parvibaculum lavamentivorans (strain DS-1 / DSM 13023 / NCIMB 13966) TaxID=402881 RepID=A7HVZ6_PARL1|nr:cation diffusion facilitator family transporter [Parvibaculum lavamentivorans]ABS64079.1 cation diffusion facilitator family transporter [Parvibaculum lavamentivorans DS-1]
MSAHQHSHDHHDHSHHGHAHGMGNERRVMLAMWLTGGFMIVEAVGGVISGSLALIADAGHMLTDTGALMLAWMATRFARRPADVARSYGYARAEILAAFANGIVMIGVVLWICFEAVGRIMTPAPILGGPMLAIAAAGLAVNIVAFKLLHGGESNLNMRGAALHVVGDMLGSVAAIVAAIVILFTGYTIADPILSVLVALLILRSAIAITKESAHILMEGTPAGTDGKKIADDLMENVEGLADVHHVHAWSLGSNRAVATLHAQLKPETNAGTALDAIKARLAGKFGIGHATVQIEPEECPDHKDAPHKH